jgi:hypothetical protein
MVEKWNGVLYSLSGFEISLPDGEGVHLNFVLSNGARSTQIAQRDDDLYYFDHMIPADALKRIRSVNIHYNDYYITGFFFFDKNGALLWEIRTTGFPFLAGETVVEIAENEVIIGVKARHIRPSTFSDF